MKTKLRQPPLFRISLIRQSFFVVIVFCVITSLRPYEVVSHRPYTEATFPLRSLPFLVPISAKSPFKAGCTWRPAASAVSANFDPKCPSNFDPILKVLGHVCIRQMHSRLMHNMCGHNSNQGSFFYCQNQTPIWSASTRDLSAFWNQTLIWLIRLLIAFSRRTSLSRTCLGAFVRSPKPKEVIRVRLPLAPHEIIMRYRGTMTPLSSHGSKGKGKRGLSENYHSSSCHYSRTCFRYVHGCSQAFVHIGWNLNLWWEWKSDRENIEHTRWRKAGERL